MTAEVEVFLWVTIALNQITTNNKPKGTHRQKNPKTTKNNEHFHCIENQVPQQASHGYMTSLPAVHNICGITHVVIFPK